MTDVILTEVEDNSGMLAAINENFDKLETAINLTLSKANDAVNTLHTTLDANSQRLINLPAPVDGTDAARLVDITGTGTTVSLPSVTGQAGKFLGTDGTTALWTSFSTISIPTSQITGDLTGNAANVNGTVTVAHGGTGATTLTGYVKGAGTSALTASATIPGTDITGNIAGNAAGLSTTLAIASGGTGQTTATNAINALVPAQTGNGGKYLSTNGSVVSWQSAPSGGGGGTVTDITAGAGLTGGLITISGTISITDTGVTAASYGAASKTLTATVNSRGQLTSLAETPIAITGAQVSGNIAGNAAGLTSTLAIASGGTGATTDAAARTALGATTVGTNVFTAVDAAAARTAIGAGTGNGNGTVTSITQGTGLSFSATPLTATGTISIDSTVVTLTGTQTLTNKTITFPVISSISNTGTITLPTTTDTLVGRITTDTLQNKTMSGSSNTFSNIPISALTGGPLSVALGGSGAATFTAGYLKASGTTAFTTVSTIPYTDITGTSSLVTLTGTQTLTNKTIAGTQITGNISGNAANVTGTVGYANGGTNATTQAAAQINMLPSQATHSGKFLTTDGTNASWAPATAVTLYVDTIAAMVALVKATLTDGQTISVAGYTTRNDGGGGWFIWDSASTATTNVGLCFQAAAGGTGRWLRVHNSSLMNVRWFGAVSGGVSDESTNVQAAYDACLSAANPATLFFPAGTYICSFNVTTNYIPILGEGPRTLLKPSTTTGVVMTLTGGTLLTTFTPISDMKLQGTGTRQGSGIKGLVGAHWVLIERVWFDNFDKCIERNGGNFTWQVLTCCFEVANYHIHSLGVASAHCGDIKITGTSARQAELACFFFDNASGPGQAGGVTISGTIQGNPGYVFFMKNMDGEGVPASRLTSAWNEGNATNPSSITVGGVSAVPVWGYFENCNSVVVEDTALSLVKLVNSNLMTKGCDLTYFLPVNGASAGSTMDATSSLTHDHARYTNYLHTFGRIRSFDRVKGIGLDVGAGSWVRTITPSRVAAVLGSTTHLRNDASAVIAFTGTTSHNTVAATDTGILGLTTCQDLIETGAATENMTPDTGGTAITAGRYIVAVLVAKKLSGTGVTVRLGTTGSILSSPAPLNDTDFVQLKLFGVSPGTSGVGSTFISYQFASAAAFSVRIAGLAILSFASLELAMDYMNSDIFPA